MINGSRYLIWFFFFFVNGFNSGTKKPSDKKSNRDASNDCSIQSLSSEVALLNERNKHMEEELREMQDKYSEISLKFAEVEGERQQLVMSLRNLKNGKKT